MKIDITKEEYRLLLDVLSISDWIMNSHIVGDNPKSEPYKKLEQKFMSYAKELGFDNLIIYDKSLKAYFPTKEYEELESDRQFIDEYEEEYFWDELCSSLARRDLIKEKGVQAVKEMGPIKSFTEEDKIAEKYDNEFIENGIKHLIISKNKA